jgi:phage terminase large subunit-like protein
MPPPGDWNVWNILAGRGFGKTRVGAETLSDWAITSPDTRWLVAGPTSGDVRGVCFEGESGLLAVIPPELVVNYNKSLSELTVACLDGGTSLIKGIPAEEPERFRGVLSAGAQDQRNS